MSDKPFITYPSMNIHPPRRQCAVEVPNEILLGQYQEDCVTDLYNTLSPIPKAWGQDCIDLQNAQSKVGCLIFAHC